MPCVPALVRWIMVLPEKSTSASSKGELPKSNSGGGLPPTSPMQMSPIPFSRSANASSTVPTMMTLDAPLASATAAVVKARNTSITATVPVARCAPSRRLWIEIFMDTSAG